MWAEAQYRGDTGVKEKERDTRIQRVQFEAQAIEVENTRNLEMAKTTSAMNVQKAEYERQAHIAQIEATKAVQIRDSELQRDLEIKKIAQETERQRSELLSKTVVEAEAKERLADADLYKAKRHAEGIRAEFDAQAEGLRQLFSAAPNHETVLTYLALDRRLYPEMAAEYGKAIQGLRPKITQTNWTTAGAGQNAVGELLKAVPQFASTIHEQTGFKLPGWMLDMSNVQTPFEAEAKETEKGRRILQKQ